jgi:hypothetical protein
MQSDLVAGAAATGRIHAMKEETEPRIWQNKNKTDDMAGLNIATSNFWRVCWICISFKGQLYLLYYYLSSISSPHVYSQGLGATTLI